MKTFSLCSLTEGVADFIFMWKNLCKSCLGTEKWKNTLVYRKTAKVIFLFESLMSF